MKKIHIAAKNGDVKEIERQLSKSVPIDTVDPRTGSSAIHYACQYGQEKAALYLIKKGAQLHLSTNNEYRPLILAIETGMYSVVKSMLEHSVNPQEAGNSANYTPLHAAVASNHIRIARLLLRMGVNVNAKTVGEWDDHSAPLHEAICRDNIEAIRLLLRHGADVDIEDYSGSTALKQAAARGDLALMRLLLASGADVNKRKKGGSTALHFAAVYNKEKAVKLLLQRGADPNLTNENGKTALEAAEEYNAHNSCEILRGFARRK